MFVCCECRVLSGRGLCDELITRPEESYRLWCVVVCDIETSRMRKAMTRVGSQRHREVKLRLFNKGTCRRFYRPYICAHFIDRISVHIL
jgi:hypothetical protein